MPNEQSTAKVNVTDAATVDGAVMAALMFYANADYWTPFLASIMSHDRGHVARLAMARIGAMARDAKRVQN